MFGYVNVFRDELKIKDYNMFRAYYCGLCKAIGGKCSHAARLGLSYDMTFLAVMLSSVSDAPVCTDTQRCVMHPFNKRSTVIKDDAVEYSAYMSVLLAYLKFADDWADDKSVKALAGMTLYRPAVNKAYKKYPETYDKIKEYLNKLSILEEKKCPHVDETADCFAKILELLFTPDFIENKDERKILAWLGYNIGRWIYIIDAYNDIDKDAKKGSYNPFLCMEYTNLEEHKRDLSERLSDSLTLTLANAASAFDLLDIKKNRAILENILFLSLQYRQNAILQGIGCKGNNGTNERLPGKPEQLRDKEKES